MKKKVLVFPCGSEIGIEVYNSVNNSLHFELYGLSSVADHGKFVYENYIEGIGFYTDPKFIFDLKFIIRKYKIDILFPTMDSVISHLKFYEEEIGIPIVGPSYDVAKICSSKQATYNYFVDKVRVPKLYSKVDTDYDFPLFVKPDVGYGSRNVSKVDNFDQLNSIDVDNMILCEYLPGEEYTIDCFTGLNGDLLFSGARERTRIMNGISVNTKTSNIITDRFRSIAEIINCNIQFKGAWFFQMKLDSKDEPCLLEIACRFAGSSGVHRVKGVNFALSSLFLTIGIDSFFLINNFEIESDRSLNNKYKLFFNYDTIFIDYDDTIIINEKVNLDVIQIIYQSLNENKNIILVTKHKGDIVKSLERFKLTNLFHKVLHLTPNDEKFIFIKDMRYDNSIFIDDSFEERKKIYFELGIPVFSVDSVKALLK